MKMKNGIIAGTMLLMTAVCSTTCYADEIYVDLRPGKIGDMGNQMPKNPIQVPEAIIDEYEFTVSALGYDVTLQLFDEDGYVVYSVYVPAGTTVVYLPTTLSGEFEIRLVTSSFYFYGFITL